MMTTEEKIEQLRDDVLDLRKNLHETTEIIQCILNILISVFQQRRDALSDELKKYEKNNEQ